MQSDKETYISIFWNDFRNTIANKFFQIFADCKSVIATPTLLIKHFIDLIFFFLFISSSLSLLYISYLGLIEIYLAYPHKVVSQDIASVTHSETNISESKIIHGIELIFISPLPLLIISSFKNYYQNVISFTIHKEQKDAEYLERNRSAALKDLSVVKYLFISILISTIFIVILEVLFDLKSQAEDITDSKIPHSGIISIIEKYSGIITISLFALVFLLIYLKILSRHLPNDKKTKENKSERKS